MCIRDSLSSLDKRCHPLPRWWCGRAVGPASVPRSKPPSGEPPGIPERPLQQGQDGPTAGRRGR
eukprot:5698166-Lingulodinium_polyedra.AAC.1